MEKTEWIECPKCKGVGLIIPPHFSGPSVDCIKCNGEGFFKVDIRNIGIFKIALKKRTQPIKEYQELANVIDEFKEAFANSLIIPVINWINKVFKKSQFWSR